MNAPGGRSTTVAELVEYVKQGEQQRVTSILLQHPNIKKQKNFHNVVSAAVEADGKDIIVWLLNNGYSKNTVLEICINNGNETVINMVLDAGADLEEALYFAVKANKNRIIELLLKRGVNINTAKRNGNTPLHTAILQKCDLCVVQLLIENGAIANARTNKNKNAVDLVAYLLETANDATSKQKFEKIQEVLKHNKISDNVVKCLQGLPDGLSGYSYQIKLFTLYAIKNTKLSSTTQCQYELGTELKDLLPFDDVYLKRTTDGSSICEFVQVKQTKKPEFNKLQESNFFSILKCEINMKDYIKGNESIVKMFMKFAEIEQSYVENGFTGQYIYCTNTHFQKVKNTCFAITEENSNLLCGVGGLKWKIADWRYLIYEIKFVLLNLIFTSLCTKAIEQEFKTQIETQIQILYNIEADNMEKDNTDQSTVWSVSKIATEGSNVFEKYLGILDTCKIKIKNADDAKSVKDNFPEECELPHLTEDEMRGFKTACITKINEVYKCLKSEKEIFILFSKWDDGYIIEKIRSFVNHFSLYTACPTSDELDDIITKEISEEFKFHKKLLSYYCVQYFSKWVSNFKNERGKLFKHGDGKKLFQDLRVQILKGFNKSYIEDLHFNDIHFKNNSEILEFLSGTHSKILHVVTDHARLHAIKIFQALKDMENQATDFTYLDNVLLTNSELIFKSEETLNNFLSAFSSDVSIDLLVIEFFDDFNEVDNTFEILDKFRNIITNNTKKKIIVIAKKDNALATALKFIVKGSKAYQGAFGFKDLENDSQECVMNKYIDFQNYPKSSRTDLKIKDFLTTTAACQVIDESLLSAIIKKNEHIKLGSREVFYSDVYNKEYYIPRQVHQQIVDIAVLRNFNVPNNLFFVTGITIRHLTSKLNIPDVQVHVWVGSKTSDSGIILLPDTYSTNINTHQEIYDQISNKCSNKNIYWLEYKDDFFFLKAMKYKTGNSNRIQVEGSEMSMILNKHCLPPENLDQKIIILSNNPGEGKSTMLTHLAHVLRKKSQYLWIIRVELRNHADNTLAISLNDVTFCEEETSKAIEFITRMVIQDNASNDIKLERKLLEGALHGYSRTRVVLLFDGFDEISPGYKDKTCTLLKALAKSEVKQLWVTTRLHLMEYLEEQLQVPACMMSTFTEDEQVRLLNKLWRWYLINYKEDATSDKQIILGILGQLRLCYEKCYKYDKEQCNAEIKKLSKLKLLDLQKYISDEINLTGFAKTSLKTWKFSIIAGDDFLKVPLNLEMMAKNMFLTKWKISKSEDIHLFEIYKEFVDNKLNIYTHVKSTSELGNQASKDQADVAAVTYMKMHREVAVRTLFHHLRFLPELNISKEYVNSDEKLVRIGLMKSYGIRLEFIHRSYAEYFFAEYLSVHLEDPTVQSKFFTNVLINDEYHLVRTFLDGFLSRTQLIESTVNENCPKEYNLKNVLTPVVTKDIVTKKNGDNENVLHIAARGGHPQIFWFIFNNITSTDFSKLILETASENHSVLHLATVNGHNELFRVVLDTVMTVPQIQKELIMVCNKHGNTCLHLAALLDRREICSMILKRVQFHSDIFKEFIIKENIRGLTAIHVALNLGKTEIFDIISEFIEEDPNLFTDIILQFRETFNNFCDLSTMPLSRAITNTELIKVSTEGCANALKDLMGLYSQFSLTAMDVAGTYAQVEDGITNPAQRFSIFNDLIVQLDNSQRSALHVAAKTDNTEVCNVILKTAIKFSALDELILKSDFLKQTALHVAANEGSKNVCEIILKSVSQQSVLRDLILQGDCVDRTALHFAAENGNIDVCNSILKSAENNSIFNLLVMSSDTTHKTALHLATEERRAEVCNAILEMSEKHSVFKDLIMKRDVNKETAFHIAADKGMRDFCTVVMQTAERCSILKEVIFQCGGNDGTVLHVAAQAGKADVCDVIMRVAKKHSFLNELLMKTNGDDLTALQAAAENGKIDACDQILKTAKKCSMFNDLIMKCDANNRTVLHIAANSDQSNVCDFIMQRAKQYDVFNDLIMRRDCDNMTALHLAAENGHTKVCDVIMKTAKRYSIFNELILQSISNDGSILHAAAENGHGDVCSLVMETAKKYLIFNELIMIRDKNKNTVLHLAASSGYAKLCDLIMKSAIDHPDIFMDLLTKSEQTALHVAAWTGSSEVCEVIMNNAKSNSEIFANLMTKADESAQTALHIAAWNGRIDVCNAVILTAQEYPHILKDLLTRTNKNKRTSLHLAAFNGFTNVCEMIIKSAIKTLVIEDLLVKCDENYQTVLHLAARNGHTKVYILIMKTIKESSEIIANLVTKLDRTKRTVLNLAARNGHSHVCEVIIDTIKDFPDIVKDLMMKCDRNRRTPLHLAAWHGNVKVCEVIIKKAKEYDVIKELLASTDRGGLTALDLAKENRHRNICEIIEAIHNT